MVDQVASGEHPGEIGPGARRGEHVSLVVKIDLASGEAVYACAGHLPPLLLTRDADPEVLRFPVPMFAFRDQDGNVLRLVEPPR